HKGRKNNQEKTREHILQEAVSEFVAHRLSPPREEAIEEPTKTSKRKIKYNIRRNEQLYHEDLQKLNRAIRKT
ncbi:TetR/AcrR family transcriptional regulator, partial [Pseudomonas syringae pv. tagetis]